MKNTKFNKPRLSVVMPVYNAEKYLHQTFEGLLKQTLQDYEIIAVDDGSTDGSPAICDEYGVRDSRIQVVHLDNQGSWNARNTGIDLSEGKYLYFIDADDWIEPDWLEQLVSSAEEVSADLVVAGFSMEYETANGCTTYFKELEEITYELQQDFRNDVYKHLNDSVMSLPWNKLFLRERVMTENIRFKNKRMPDHFFCVDYLSNTKCVRLIRGGGYHWRRALTSSNTQRDNKSVELFSTRVEHYDAMLNMYKAWGMDNNKEALVVLSTFLVSRSIQCMQEVASNSEIPKRRAKQIIANICKNESVIRSLQYAEPDSKVMRIMMIPLRLRLPELTYLMGSFIGWVRKSNPEFFYKLKEHVVHNA